MMLRNLQKELDKDRIYGLDILRCLAILMVLAEHGMFLLKPMMEEIEVFKLGGFWGVELFFVLSGFLIGGILLKIYDSEVAFSGRQLLDFWKRRWFRTLPNYFLMLVVNLVLAYVAGRYLLSEAPYHFLYFFFAQNIVDRHPDFFAEAWSLAIEEWFYLLFPGLLLGIAILKNWTKKRRFLLVIIVLFLFSILMRFRSVMLFDAHWDADIRKMVFLRMDALLTGVLFAWIYFYYKKSFIQFKNACLGLGLILLTYSCYNFYTNVYANGFSQTSFWSKTFYFNITSLAFAFCLPYANEIKLKGKLSGTAKGITTLSIVSYAMYLLHLSIIMRLMYKLAYWNTSIGTALFLYALYLGLTVISSILLYNYFEKPMTDLRDRF